MRSNPLTERRKTCRQCLGEMVLVRRHRDTLTHPEAMWECLSCASVEPTYTREEER